MLLKEELISNGIYRINIAHFNAEHLKAKLNHNSEYCKRRINGYSTVKCRWNFLLQHVLVLQIYCGFTDLQFQFSKTYRTSEGRDQSNFYLMGLYPKIVTQVFGTNVSEGNCKQFYHGMSEDFLFPDYFLVKILAEYQLDVHYLRLLPLR